MNVTIARQPSSGMMLDLGFVDESITNFVEAEAGAEGVAGSGGTIRVNLNDVNNDGVYSGQLFVGNPSQPATVIFDTGSEYLGVTSDLCKTQENGVASCPSQAYNSKNSKDSKLSENSKSFKINFGHGRVQGEDRIDRLCLTSENNCVNQMTFLALS